MPLGAFRLNGLTKIKKLSRVKSTISGTRNSTTAKIGTAGWGFSTSQSGNFNISLTESIGGTSPCTIEFWAYKGTESGSTPNSIMSCDGIGYFQNRLNSGNDNWGIIYNSIVAANTANGVASAYNHIAFQTDPIITGKWWWWVNGHSIGSFNASGSSFSSISFGRLNQFSTGVFTIRFDEIRVSKIRRYTNGSNFTPSTAAFANDANTLALFHCDTESQTDDTL